MAILVMLVPDFAEEVDAVRAREQRGGDRMHRRVAPALFCAQSPVRDVRFTSRKSGQGRGKMYLVVEAAVVIEMVEVRQIDLSAPKVHVANLKVVIDYFCIAP